jgi:predicted transcriptional regulator
MSALTIRLPNSLHAKIRELAAREEISVNQFIASAAGEKLASLLTADHLRQEAAQGRRVDFDRFMRAVPDVPDEADLNTKP